MLIGGFRTEENTVGAACGQRLGWQDVEDVCGGNQSFDPVGGWKAGLDNNERTVLLMERMIRSAHPFCAEV
jgi:hypothetical protein